MHAFTLKQNSPDRLNEKVSLLMQAQNENLIFLRGTSKCVLITHFSKLLKRRM